VTTILPERRKIAVVSGDARSDIVVPSDETLGEALRALGYAIEPGRHVVLERGGAEAQLNARGSDLPDGALYAIVDVLANRSVAEAVRVSSAPLIDRGAAWWLLSMVAVVAVGLDIVAGSDPAHVFALAVASASLGIAALVSAAVYVVRPSTDAATTMLGMVAPLSLAFASGFVAVPLSLAAGLQLAILTGFLAAAVVGAVFTATIGGLRARSSSGMVTVILLALAAVWGVVLLVGAAPAVAAAISVGMVPLVLRGLPSSLVNVAEGHFIDYGLFMSNRWSVRGSIPEAPGAVRIADVRGVVADSTARLFTGTLVASILPVVFVPLVLGGGLSGDPIVFGGTVGMLVTLIIALVLIPRHHASSALRWLPRVAAMLVLIEVAVAFGSSLGPIAVVVEAAAFFAIGVAAAAILVPVARGASSLVWSRLGDVLEAIAIALSLPSALLAADVLTILRGMMAS
jgi:hypothetical protein